MCEGIVDELCGVPLGDERLNQRSDQILEALAANPEASLNAACDGWSDSIAAAERLGSSLTRCSAT